VRTEDGAYEIKTKDLSIPVLVSRVGAEINDRWISSSDYPQHHEAESTFQDALGTGHQVTVNFTGPKWVPELRFQRSRS
jgi:hypothetical protein